VDNLKIEEFLGVDVGAARVGIARGNSAARLAQAIKTVEAKEAINELKVLAEEFSTNGIVIGLPRGLDGQETAQTKSVRHWVERLKAQINLPLFWQDEALTSQQAEAIKSTLGSDAQAAAIILQDFLDSQENDRVAA
jgi:putative Holliday junction resolvase